ncbi:oxidoreductase [Enterovibrio norvegicus FF-33]|uniref:Oxidoreductase n=1 Tax=Enterovibrio norvegicus FF-454 TaxID=1185651 RepID=A0A1E5BW83_9GAMM|nr:Gfo/Idh/MocA family oxidoreductase [Enterovibrio norvegicus]OEE57475.1 oxidoreductase [Enterovibrio norvegicus FF-454]OEE67256.1 oxidoreductase [Enterovibrio norvegicus FF-33]OEE85064.1 oxidoreductase [Enterovibrio norvegicus FF-162]
MEQKTIRWGMIGCGSVTERKSGPAFWQVEGSSLNMVMARREERAKAYCAKHGIPAYTTDASALINDPNIDAIYVATPPDSHREYALMAAKAGKPCVVEKPMALTTAECDDMIDAFKQANVPLFVAYYRRSLPRFQAVREWIDQGKIGAVRHIHWTYHRAPNPDDVAGLENWRVNPDQAGGGYFVDLASHGLNLFQQWFGDITTARGIAANQQGYYAAEDAVSASFAFENGVLGSGYWNFGAAIREDRVEIIGSEGRILCSVFGDEPFVLEGTEQATSSIENPDPVQYFHVENMVKHLKGEKTHPSLAESGRNTTWVMEQILAGQ